MLIIPASQDSCGSKINSHIKRPLELDLTHDKYSRDDSDNQFVSAPDPGQEAQR